MRETTLDDSWTRRIAREFEECPSLRLTPAQAARLWSLRPPGVEAILGALVATGALLRTRTGAFVRRGDCPRGE